MIKCSSCENLECVSHDGKIEVEVSEVSETGIGIIMEGDVLRGTRFDNSFYMVNYIKDNYKMIGVGICRNKNKPVMLYINDYNNIFGISTVLPYRYFDLEKVVE